MTTTLENDLDEPFFPASSIGAPPGGIFDPLGLGSPSTMPALREAEIKHGRLAMLAAIAWPLQEILHPILVDTLRAPRDLLLETGGKSPSLLNGGLGQADIISALALTVLMASSLEETDLAKRRALGLGFNEYPSARQAGNFGFDPLNIYKPLPIESKRSLHEAELTNGRFAMLAVLAYVGVEGCSNQPVVRATPELFEPLFLQSGFRALMDASFSAASMDGSIDGIAY